MVYQKKKNTYYTCIACITIDSALKINKKNYPQVYLEECKYKVKNKTIKHLNIQPNIFISNKTSK